MVYCIPKEEEEVTSIKIVTRLRLVLWGTGGNLSS
jgi:hypothetical protein